MFNRFYIKFNPKFRVGTIYGTNQDLALDFCNPQVLTSQIFEEYEYPYLYIELCYLVFFGVLIIEGLSYH